MKKQTDHSLKSSNRRIDVHHHILPPEYIIALERAGYLNARALAQAAWTPEKSLDFMEAHGVKTAITSISTPGVYLGDSSLSRDLARRCNEYAAKLVKEYPGRFGAFASLPLPDVEGSLWELEYAIDTLDLDGISLLSNVAGHYLGEPAYRELFQELNWRRLAVFIHPNDPPEPFANGQMAFVEYPHDTTRAVATLIHTGVLERFTRLRLVLAHAGGTLPYIADRVTVPGLESQVRGNPAKLLYRYWLRLRALKRLHLDIAASTDIFSLRTLVSYARPSQLLFGTNYFWSPDAVISLDTAGLYAYDGFDESALSAIEWKNAVRLFPRLSE